MRRIWPPRVSLHVGSRLTTPQGRTVKYYACPLVGGSSIAEGLLVGSLAQSLALLRMRSPAVSIQPAGWTAGSFTAANTQTEANRRYSSSAELQQEKLQAVSPQGVPLKESQEETRELVPRAAVLQRHSDVQTPGACGVTTAATEKLLTRLMPQLGQAALQRVARERISGATAGGGRAEAPPLPASALVLLQRTAAASPLASGEAAWAADIARALRGVLGHATCAL
ncbi:hypothetical protein cyc_04558 [Cyclospora cayetanensis]|uniref:Uncharacterized protein n=1 Tax=Cyclospora cayetanensis TaxID=88456 RepID=A0A1D3CXR1_9EIME|nr:hypothetical protein cyc_04558 [Cyclospora cayetanensis]